jgi:hypothetical protein
MATVELTGVYWSERQRRFEFVARAGDQEQRFGHYAEADAERHREQFADRLRDRGHDVVASSP